MLRYIYRSSIPVFLVQEMRRDMMLSLGLCLLFEAEEQINGAVQTQMSLILHQGHTSKRMHYQIHSTMQVPICIYHLAFFYYDDAGIQQVSETDGLPVPLQNSYCLGQADTRF